MYTHLLKVDIHWVIKCLKKKTQIISNLQRARDVSAMFNEGQTSEDWLTNHAIAHFKLTLKDLLTKGQVVRWVLYAVLSINLLPRANYSIVISYWRSLHWLGESRFVVNYCHLGNSTVTELQIRDFGLLFNHFVLYSYHLSQLKFCIRCRGSHAITWNTKSVRVLSCLETSGAYVSR